MREVNVLRELCIFCLICSVLRARAAESYPLTDCGQDTQGSGVERLLCDLLWRDQHKEQIQNVFKRFLFHYSKAHNAVGSMARESHFVHPLMRLSPKFTLRRKKQKVSSKLKNTCGRSDRVVRDLLCPLIGCSVDP